MTTVRTLVIGKKLASIIEKIQFLSRQRADDFPALQRSCKDCREDNPKWELYKTIVEECWKEI